MISLSFLISHLLLNGGAERNENDGCQGNHDEKDNPEIDEHTEDQRSDQNRSGRKG